MAHFLTDETFALSLAHFRRIGRFDAQGYWLGALVILVPWTVGSTIGYLAGGAVDTHRLGLDIAFPAAMAGLAVGLVNGRRELSAALAGAAIGVVASLVISSTIGIIAGGVLGPLVGLAVPPPSGAEADPAAAGLPHLEDVTP